MIRARLHPALALIAPLVLSGCSAMLDTGELAPKGAGPDRIAPTATLGSPAEGATGVALDATLTIGFSEPMNVGSVTVSTSPSVALGAPVWSAANTAVSFAPPGLVAQTNYVVNVGGSDLAANDMVPAAFHFRTIDVVPTVQTTTPLNGDTSVPTNAAIQIVFSEAMNMATVQAAFSVTPVVTCNWGESTSTTATCRPMVVLTNSQLYTVTLAATAADAGGDTLAGPLTFSFTTSAVAHTLAPTIVSSVPGSGVTGIARSTSIQMTFNEAVDKTTAEQNFGITSPTGFGGGTFTWSADGLTMTYTPPSAFGYGAVVSWRMGTGLKCLGNVSLVSQVSRSFTVLREGTVTLSSVAGLDGWMYDSDATPRYTLPSGVGDTSANRYARAFITFDFTGPSPASGLPATATAVTGATLTVAAAEIGWSGNPFGSLGSLMAQSVDYGPGLTRTDFDTPVLTWFGCKAESDLHPDLPLDLSQRGLAPRVRPRQHSAVVRGRPPGRRRDREGRERPPQPGGPWQPQPVPAQVPDGHRWRRARRLQLVPVASADDHLRVPVAGRRRPSAGAGAGARSSAGSRA